MCELFGFSSAERMDLREYLWEFFSHSYIHKDGWGVCRFDDHHKGRITKEPVCALNSEVLDSVIKTYGREDLLLAHIRLASIGSVKLANTHPFVQLVKGTDWVMIHNGTIRISLPSARKPKGDTDSEQILLKIVDALETRKKKTIRNALEKTFRQLNWFGKVNVILSNGSKLYVYRNSESLYWSTDLPRKGILIMTNPGDLRTKMKWTPVPCETLVEIQDGEVTYLGGRKSKRTTVTNPVDYERSPYQTELEMELDAIGEKYGIHTFSPATGYRSDRGYRSYVDEYDEGGE